MIRLLLIFALATGCAKDPSSAAGETPEAGAASGASGGSNASGGSGDKPSFAVPPVDPGADPVKAYAECRDRVEGPEAAGECSADSDCVKAGCSKEVCLASSNAEGFNTTCDAQPCFKVLDECKCVQTKCTWSVK